MRSMFDSNSDRPQWLQRAAVGGQQNQFEQPGQTKKGVAFGGTRTHANKVDYDLNVAP